MPKVGKPEILSSKNLVRLLVLFSAVTIDKDGNLKMAPGYSAEKDPFLAAGKTEQVESVIDKYPPFYMYDHPEVIKDWEEEQKKKVEANTDSEPADGDDVEPESEPEIDIPTFLPPEIKLPKPTPVIQPGIKTESGVLDNKDKIDEESSVESMVNNADLLLNKLKKGFNKNAGWFSEAGIAAGMLRNKIGVYKDTILAEFAMLSDLNEQYSEEIKNNKNFLIKDPKLQRVQISLAVVMYDLYESGELKNILDFEKDSGRYRRALLKKNNIGMDFYRSINESADPMGIILHSIAGFVRDKGGYFAGKSQEEILREMEVADNSDTMARMMTEIMANDPIIIILIQNTLNDLSKE